MEPLLGRMKIGSALAFVGGVAAIAAMACAWGGTIDSMYLVGLNMLVAVMFFATAGTFTKYSPVSGNTALVISALALCVVLVSMIYEATFLWLNIILAVLAVLCIAIAACPNVSRWVDANRSA